MRDTVFSPFELKVLKTLGHGGVRKPQRTITKITHLLYKEPPMRARILVSNAIRNINEKCEYHRLHWFVNSMGIGRGGKTVWIDRRENDSEA